jgi:myo-inositol-1(or 4)-monophosphatase
MDQMKVIRNLYSQGLTLRRTGSTAIDLAYVASGKLDAFLGYGMKHWDFAAGALLVKESGGYVTDLLGVKIFVLVTTLSQLIKNAMKWF